MLLREVFSVRRIHRILLPSNAAKGRLRRTALCRILQLYASDPGLLWHLVRLTDERLEHILEHAEMAAMDGEIERVLQAPTEVQLSRADDNVRLFYEFYAQTRVGGKWLCVW